MKKIVWLISLLAIAGYLATSYLDKKTKEEARRAEQERIEQKTKSSVMEMISRTNATNDWENKLCKGNKYRIEPILTLELEKLWLVNQPILFIGTVKDIATENESNYVVRIERSLIGNLNRIFATELQLSLSSPKDKIDAFLKQHPDLFRHYGLNNGVAVIAIVHEIKSDDVFGEEGDVIEIKIGEGDLVDIVYTGRVIF